MAKRSKFEERPDPFVGVQGLIETAKGVKDFIDAYVEADRVYDEAKYRLMAEASPSIAYHKEKFGEWRAKRDEIRNLAREKLLALNRTNKGAVTSGFAALGDKYYEEPLDLDTLYLESLTTVAVALAEHLAKKREAVEAAQEAAAQEAVETAQEAAAQEAAASAQAAAVTAAAEVATLAEEEAAERALEQDLAATIRAAVLKDIDAGADVSEEGTVQVALDAAKALKAWMTRNGMA